MKSTADTARSSGTRTIRNAVAHQFCESRKPFVQFLNHLCGRTLLWSEHSGGAKFSAKRDIHVIESDYLAGVKKFIAVRRIDFSNPAEDCVSFCDFSPV